MKDLGYTVLREKLHDFALYWSKTRILVLSWAFMLPAGTR